MSNDQSATTGTALEPGDFAGAAEPFALFDTWLADATRHEPNDPNAMALATVDAAGHPNVRMVLLKAVDPVGHPGHRRRPRRLRPDRAWRAGVGEQPRAVAPGISGCARITLDAGFVS